VAVSEERRNALAADVRAIAGILVRLVWLEQKRLARELSEYGLTVPQFLVLAHISRSEEACSMSALADQMRQSSATMTGIVDRLERMNLVTRTRAPNDRRLVLIQLTERGEEVLQRARQRRQAYLGQTLLKMTPGDRQELIRLLQVYQEAAQAAYRELDR